MRDLFVKVVTIRTEEKNKKTPLSKINNQKSIKSTIAMSTTLMFQHLKIMPVLFLAQETLVKPITFSKY